MATPTDGRSLLLDWANDQDNWVRGIVALVIETRKPLSEVELDHFHALFLREKELGEGELVVIPPLTTNPSGTVDEETLYLDKLCDVQNVNALAVGQSLAFNSRMNVLFGENATGKTGYVRILKSVAAVRAAEAILPNIDGPLSCSPKLSHCGSIESLP